MTTIKAEEVRTINGVKGRAYAVVTWAGNGSAKAPNEIANQKWTSYARPVDPKHWGTGATISVELRFDDECKNGRKSFAITAEIRRPGRRDVEACGCLHDEIARYFPELAHLIPWHIVDEGGPLHYVANTCYHASNRDHRGLLARDLDAARRCAVWPDAPEALLTGPREDLEAALKARLPALIADFRAAMDACGFVWSAP